MKDTVVLCLCTWLLGATAALPDSASSSESDPLERRQGGSFQALKAQYVQSTLRSLTAGGACNAQTVKRRQEWGDMSPQQQQQFISACYCLASRPARSPETGARSLWDDFVTAHVGNNEAIHVSAFLLPWHRNLGSEMERALQRECGYDGGLPYLDFTKYEGRPLQEWPIFDGSPSSLSGNGVSTSDGCSCVRSGPLAQWVVTIPPSADGTRACSQSVPRCLERRFDPTKALPILTDANIAQHIRDGVDAATFAPNLETLPQPIHSAIHDLISGLQEDVAVSPGDPMFFLIHCFLDLIWAIWQSLDYNSRTYDLAPSEAWAPERQQLKRLPPPQVSLGTPLPMTAAFPNSVRVQDVMSTFAGANCYMFV